MACTASTCGRMVLFFMRNRSVVLYSAAALITVTMIPKMLPLLWPFVPALSYGQTASSAAPDAQDPSSPVDIGWYPPSNTSVDSLASAVNHTGTYGFIFSSSQTPSSAPYSTYNWCSMPHVRPQEYVRPPSEKFKLEYVEVIHRHHKRTPYAANTFPIETQVWSCHDSALFYYGDPMEPLGNASAQGYWRRSTDPAINPFTPQGFPPYDCQFPQISRDGLDDSWQHGNDLYAVYHDLLQLIPDSAPHDGVSFRVTNNQITSQVAGMVLNGMFDLTTPYPLQIQPSGIDSLEPTYACPASNTAFSSFGPGSSDPTWTSHLTASQHLTTRLDAVSGVPPTASGWHTSFDHYFDNLSARLCHGFPLPCNATNPTLCVSPADADEVFRLGEWEYSWTYREAPGSLTASAASYGIWIEELAEHLRGFAGDVAGAREVLYRHNVAHDGSVSRLLSVLQIDVMVWPGMGSEVVFELYSGDGGAWFVRVLWGGQTLRSASPALGLMDMVPLEKLLAYFDGLVGRRASLVKGLCGS